MSLQYLSDPAGNRTAVVIPINEWNGIRNKYPEIEGSEPLSIRNEILEKQFNELAAKWKKETAGFSTMIHIAGNNNYLDIIGMGKDVVPFILKDLQEETDYWFVALKHITKANPVPKEHLGKIEKMKEDWIDWGRKNNLI